MIAVAPSHKAQLDNYINWLNKRNFQFKLLNKGDSLSGCDMLMLCGGPDVGTSPERDANEIAWFKEAYKKIPILGICRGLQISNVILGGTLYEDLSSESVKHTSNKIEIAGEPMPTLESSWHHVEMVDGKKIRVNSRHHQGIEKLSPELKCLGICDVDKLVEMAEGEKCLFVQWHPEREDVWETDAERIVSDWIQKNVKHESLLPIEQIFSYMKAKGFTVISFDRVRKSVNSTFNDKFITELVSKNSTLVKKTKDKTGKIAIKML